jgi:hypothetical protein|tara:strand:- start:49 stop:213 length:165 start_codon:yes stop_codon:yes gene_type:complete
MPVAGTAPMNKNTETPQEDSWSAAKRFLVLFAAATALLAGTAEEGMLTGGSGTI